MNIHAGQCTHVSASSSGLEVGVGKHRYTLRSGIFIEGTLKPDLKDEVENNDFFFSFSPDEEVELVSPSPSLSFAL